MNKNKKCIITYITGNYDNLIEPIVITPDWDYICITDNPRLKSKNWNVKQIDENDKQISCLKRRASSIVMQYYKYIPNTYDVCMIIDANMEITGNLNIFLDEFNFDHTHIDLMLGQHPNRDCIYKEAEEIIKLKKDDPTAIRKHVTFLKKDAYPKNNGLCESGVLVMSRNSEKCLKFLKQWYSDYKRLPSKRDQMSLNYSIWKSSFNVLICERNNHEINQQKRRPFNKYINIKTHYKNNSNAL